MRFCRGFICYSLLEIQLECALFVPYNQKNTFSEHFDRPEKSKCQVGQGPHDDFRLQSAQGFCGPVPGSLYSGGKSAPFPRSPGSVFFQRVGGPLRGEQHASSGCRSKGLGCFPTSSCRARAHDFQRRSSKQRLRIFESHHLLSQPPFSAKRGQTSKNVTIFS